MSGLRQAVILCGGLGTRLRPYTDTLPKPMIPVNGRPFLRYLVEQLREQGIERIVLLTGYHGEQIEDHFDDGRRFGVAIDYSRGPAEWDTGRRLWQARDQLDPHFLLLYSDNFIPFDLSKLRAFHQAHGCPLSLSLCAKVGGNIRVGDDGIVQQYDPSRAGRNLDHVEIGYMIVERDAVVPLIDPPDISFSRVLARLAETSSLAGLVYGDRYHSISDPERWKITEEYLRLKRILLIDRDGTLNVRPPRGEYLAHWDDFHWVRGALEGLEALAAVGFSFILLSNQAGIARGIVSRAQVDAINACLAGELNCHGVDLLEAYVCPHHWDDGCACRKPAPGLFFEASRKHLLRLDRTFYIGDDPRDCQAAHNANCRSIFVGDDAAIAGLRASGRPEYLARTLSDAAPWIVSHFRDWEQGARAKAETVGNDV